MTGAPDFDSWLKREIRQVKAPGGLWENVEAAINLPQPALRRAHQPRYAMWLLAAAAILAIALVPVLSRRRAPAFDLQAYLAPVQNASGASSIPAIYEAPPNFESVPDPRIEPLSLDGYRVAVRRAAYVKGEPVRQMVLTSADDTVALFIASAKLRLETGANRWVEENFDGLACKRLNCPRVRTLQFPCSKETCVIVCKACSEKVMSALMTAVVARAPDFR